MAGVLYRLGRLCANRAIVVVAVWLGLVVLVRLVVWGVGAETIGRILEVVHRVVDGLAAEELAFRVDSEANSVAWLVWHLTRIQDDHVAGVAGVEQVWTSQGWEGRFGLPFDLRDTGYGHRAAEVAAVRVGSGELLVGYHDAVHQQTTRYVEGLGDNDLARVVDRSWDPPVTLGCGW